MIHSSVPKTAFSAFNKPLLSLVALCCILIGSYLFVSKNLTIFLIGCSLGATLNYFQFGFRTCSQQLLSRGKTLGIRALLVMLAVSSLLFFSLLSLGTLNGQMLTGFVQPLSLSVVAGAFLFGFGMQFASGCTSGTLNRLGQLQPLSLVTFIAILIGGVMAAYHSEFWQNVPALPPVSLLTELGLTTALLLQLTFLAMLYIGFSQKEKRYLGHLEPLFTQSMWKIGYWHPWLSAGVLLALLNALLLVISGQPWSIANIFPIWGIQLAELLYLPLDWSFWQYGITHFNRIETPIWQDTVGLTTLGIVAGALMVTLSQPKLSKHQDREALTTHFWALLGGLLMGYGAVIAFGCNIGAFFSGISSGSLHGWLWAVSALAGSALGLLLKKR